MISWKHHAYIIECEPRSIDKIKDLVISSYTSAKTPLQRTESSIHSEVPSVEIRHFTFDACGIDEAKQIVHASITTAFHGQNERLMFITAHSITNEAQNTLLKFFEEPNIGLKVVLFLPNNYPVLPTLKSRVEFIKYNENESERTSQITQTFYNSMSLSDRIKYVDDLAQAVSDEKKNKSDVSGFLKELEYVIQQEMQESVRGKQVTTSSIELKKKMLTRKAQAILSAEEYLFDQSCSLKILLERVAMA